MSELLKDVPRCGKCGVGMFAANPKPTPIERQTYKALGWKRKCGRGVCVNCYEHHRHAGTLEQLPLVRRAATPDDVDAKGCVRCGVKHRSLGELCQDCDLVVADLGEVDRWAS